MRRPNALSAAKPPVNRPLVASPPRFGRYRHGGPLPTMASVARQGGEWTYREIPASHAVMLSAPTETATLLLEAGMSVR